MHQKYRNIATKNATYWGMAVARGQRQTDTIPSRTLGNRFQITLLIYTIIQL